MPETPSSGSSEAADPPLAVPSQSTDWTEKQLPPVKPPTAGLLVQLFFVPMVIVAIIVGVWLMFGWLAESGTRPETLAARLDQLNKGSWQDAHRLSNMLRDPRQEELRNNEQLAGQLAVTLTGLMEADLQEGGEPQKLALWLCRALGHFDVDTGLPALVEAISSSDLQIRLEAVKAAGALADRLHQATPQADLAAAHPELMTALERCAIKRAELPENEIPLGMIRSAAAFSFGIIGGDQARDVLASMLSDAYPDVRYNAATGLARQGDERALPRLIEMLDLENQEALRYETKVDGAVPRETRSWKIHHVIFNGLEATQQLFQRNPSLRVPPLLEERLLALRAAGEVKGELRIKLKETMRVLALE